MSNQTIRGYFADLTPFRAIAEDANQLVIVPIGVGITGPEYNVIFGQKIPGKPAIPGTPATPQVSGPGLPNYQPAQPAVAETPAEPDTFIQHRAERLVLTQSEWDNWDKTTTDEAYIRSIAVKRFGLTLA